MLGLNRNNIASVAWVTSTVIETLGCLVFGFRACLGYNKHTAKQLSEDLLSSSWCLINRLFLIQWAEAKWAEQAFCLFIIIFLSYNFTILSTWPILKVKHFSYIFIWWCFFFFPMREFCFCRFLHSRLNDSVCSIPLSNSKNVLASVFTKVESFELVVGCFKAV